MKPVTRAIRDAARLIEAGRTHSYVIGWMKAGGYSAREARKILAEAREKAP